MVYVKRIFTKFQTTFLLVLRKKLANYRNGFLLTQSIGHVSVCGWWVSLLTMVFSTCSLFVCEMSHKACH